jgi:hypothetical protein
MTEHHLSLVLLPGVLAICRLGPAEGVPAWADSGGFCSVTRTAEELSIVCPQEDVPDGIRCVRGWRCLRVAGTLDFSLVGVMAGLVAPLAVAGVSVFPVCTFDTDHLLVREADLARAVDALRASGHTVVAEG